MTHRKITRSLLAAVAIASFAGACGSSDDSETNAAESSASEAAPGEDAPEADTPGASSSAVAIKGFAFAPPTVKVAVGSTVTWTNDDTFAHSVIADDKSFKSEDMAKSATFEHTFEEAGEYPYFCGIHNSMRGVIEVA